MPHLVVTRSTHGLGGVQRVSVQLAQGLADEGTACTLLQTRPTSGGRWSGYASAIRACFAVLSAQWKSRQSVVVLTVTGAEMLLFAGFARLLGQRFVLWEHGHPAFFATPISARWLQRWFYPSAHAVVVLHPAFVRDRPQHVRWHCIPNACPMVRHPARGRQESESAPIERLVWLGRFSNEKRPQLALAAMAALCKALPHFACHFYTDAPAAASKVLGLSGVHVHSGEGIDLSSLLNPRSALLLTSSAEGMPLVLFEALSAGACVLSTESTPWIGTASRHTDHVLPLIESNDPLLIATSIRAAIEELNGKARSPRRLSEWLASLSEPLILARWKELLEAGATGPGARAASPPHWS